MDARGRWGFDGVDGDVGQCLDATATYVGSIGHIRLGDEGDSSVGTLGEKIGGMMATAYSDDGYSQVGFVEGGGEGGGDGDDCTLRVSHARMFQYFLEIINVVDYAEQSIS